MVYVWHFLPTGIGRLRVCFKQLLSILILVAGFVEDVELATADGQRHLWLVGLPPRPLAVRLSVLGAQPLRYAVDLIYLFLGMCLSWPAALAVILIALVLLVLSSR